MMDENLKVGVVREDGAVLMGFSKGKPSWRLLNYDKIRRKLLRDARRRARKQNVEFNITTDDFELFEICPALGIPIDYSIGKGVVHPNSPSLDKINPKRGYVKGNIIIISFKANSMKERANAEEIRKLAAFVSELESDPNKVEEITKNTPNIRNRFQTELNSLDQVRIGKLKEPIRAEIMGSVVTMTDMVKKYGIHMVTFKNMFSDDKEVQDKLVHNRYVLRHTKLTCPHCGLTATASNMKRYHFDSCKKKPNNTLEKFF